MSLPVIIPLINPNEPEAVIADLLVREGQQVAEGDLLCSLETTKTTADLLAEAAGYISALRFGRGDTVRPGDILCYLAPDPGWRPAPPPEAERAAAEAQPPDELPAGLRITGPALDLARGLELDLRRLPLDILITEAYLKDQHLPARPLPAGPDFAPPLAPFDPSAILIYGGGGHAKMVIDLLRALGSYRIVGIVDDGRPPGEMICGVPVLGGAGSLSGAAAEGIRLAVNAVGGIGSIGVRIKIFRRLAEAGFACPALVHPTAYLDGTARLSPGAQVFVHAYVGSEAQIGYGCIVNTGAIVSHDCRLGDFVNISPGAILAGDVEVGSGALVGMGATVNLGVKIGAGARIGNSATVKNHVPAGAVVRAGTIWPLD
jgi:acetyltransferase EpsM